MKKSENMRELEYLASSQWGLFTTAQAARLGVGRTQVSRLAAGGAVEQVRRGAWRYAAGEVTPHLRAKAAWLSCYPGLTAAERLRERPHDAVLACNTAAALHGIGDLHEDPYTFVVRARRQTTSCDLAFHLWGLDERDVTYVDALPVTTMERTVCDLVRERHDPDQVATVAKDALLRGADDRRLRELLGGLGPAYGGEAVLRAADDALSEAQETLVWEIVGDIMATQGEHEREGGQGERRPSQLERAYASIVRRRLRPILEARAAEIEERRRREADATRPAGDASPDTAGDGSRGRSIRLRESR